MPKKSNKLMKKFLTVLILAGPGTVLSPIVTPPVSAAVPTASAPAEGVIRQKSDFSFDETVTRLKGDIATKGIRFFDAIDH